MSATRTKQGSRPRHAVVSEMAGAIVHVYRPQNGPNFKCRFDYSFTCMTVAHPPAGRTGRCGGMAKLFHFTMPLCRMQFDVKGRRHLYRGGLPSGCAAMITKAAGVSSEAEAVR